MNEELVADLRYQIDVLKANIESMEVSIVEYQDSDNISEIMDINKNVYYMREGLNLIKKLVEIY